MQNPSPLLNIELQTYCEKLERRLRIVEEEKKALERLIQDKEKSFKAIQSQLQMLKRKITHHRSTWAQIAEDNKLLKNQIIITSPESANEKDFLRFHIDVLLNKVFTGVSSTTQKNYVFSLFNNDKYFSCLQEVVLACVGFLEDAEESFGYCQSPKVLQGQSLENAISPINQKNYSEDDEEIDRLLNESKHLLKSLDRQNGKLNFRNEF